MQIGELSISSGLSRDTIRWYEKVGLLSTEDSLRGSNNYRIYNQRALDKLILIKQSKSFGFSLDEIKEMLASIEVENLNCEVVSPMIDSKLEVIAEKIALLQNIQMKLVKLKAQCSGDCKAEILKDTVRKS